MHGPKSSRDPQGVVPYSLVRHLHMKVRNGINGLKCYRERASVQ